MDLSTRAATVAHAEGIFVVIQLLGQNLAYVQPAETGQQ